MITKRKLDATFPTNQLFTQVYSIVYRMDRNDKGREIMILSMMALSLYVQNDIPSQQALRRFAQS